MGVFSYTKRFVSLYLLKKKWKHFNSHNQTSPENIFPLGIVTVGKHCYGPLEIYSWGEAEEGLIIGSYVSIAYGVKFVLGGNHRMNTFTTYPIKAMFLGEKVDSLSKGKIIVEDDVWIGTDALILSGAHIGKGAIIGARTVVSGNIPAYAVVVGNPGRIIKYRFNNKLIDELKKIDLQNIPDDFFRKNVDLLYKSLTQDNLAYIIERLRILK